MKNNIKGVGVALITPFTQNGGVDYNALERVLEHITRGGVDYVVALGTTAETATLSRQEQQDIFDFVRKHNRGGLPLVVGLGGNSTEDVVRRLREFDMDGASAVLNVTPYYNKPNQRGLLEHYRAVAGASPLPVILYNVPGRTGVNMSAETTLQLASEVPNILGIKEACGLLPQITYLLRDRPEGFLVISGDDGMAFPVAALGGDGVISVAANALPELLVELVHATTAGDNRRGAALHLRLQEVIDALFVEGSPVGIKTLLAAKGMIENRLRLPLVTGSDGLMERFRQLIRRYDL